MYDRTIFKNMVQNNLNIEKIIFKDVQMKFLPMQLLINNYLYGSKCTKYLHGT